MKLRPRAALLALVLLTAASTRLAAQNPTWTGAGNDLWADAGNWNPAGVPAVNTTVVVPAGTPNPSLDLGGVNRDHRIVSLEGGVTLRNGQIRVQGGGGQSEIRSVGNNTVAANFGSFGDGNGVKFVQLAPGTLTITGNRQSGISPFVLNATHPQGRVVFAGTFTSPSREHLFTGTGWTEVAAGGVLTGGGTAFNARVTGRLLFNGSDLTTHANWIVNETRGALYGTGTVRRPVLVGSDTPGRISPGPAAATGTLNVESDVTFGPRGHLEIELGPGAADRLAITGNLVIDAQARLTARPLGVGPAPGSYTVVTFTGTRSGTFQGLGLPTNWSLDHSVPGEIRVVVAPAPVAASLAYPADAGVLNVTLPPYSAVPNDGLDDTAAIQAALNAFANGNRIIFLPNGVYDVSDTLSWPAGTPGATDFKRTVLEGETRDGAILRLAPNLPAFAAGANRPVIYTGPSPAQRFRNAVRNLTVEIGAGNPGADGIHFNASNQGTVREVRIVAAPGSGRTGLNLAHTAEIGPLLVKNVEVVGFDFGIRTSDAINGIVLEHIRCEGQRIAGIQNIGQVFTLRGYTSVNSVPAILSGESQFGGLDKGGVLTVLDAQLVGVDPAPLDNSLAAIRGSSFALLRGVRSTGYLRVHEQPVLNGVLRVNDSDIAELSTAGTVTNFPSPATTLGLPIAETPIVPRDPLAQWVSPLAFGAAGNGTTDDTAAVQAALDAGFPTVYFPGGLNFRLNGTVFVRGAVRRLIGTEGRISGSGRIVVEDGTAPVVIIERCIFPHIEHRTSRTLVLAHLSGDSITSTGSGDLFLEDVVCSPVTFGHPRQRVWARQLNTEGTVTNVINRGSAFWLFGYKTERGATKIETTDDGFTEVFGHHNYSTGAAKRVNPADPTSEPVPLYRSVESSVTFATMGESNFEGTTYLRILSETRNGSTAFIESNEVFDRTAANGKAFTLLSGYTGAPKGPVDLTGARTSDTTVDLAWTDVSWNETGFVVEQSEDGGASYTPALTTAAGATAVTVTGLAAEKSYLFRLRAENALGLSRAAGPVTAATLLPPYEVWRYTFFNAAERADPNLSGPQADPNGNGLPNVIDYLLGNHPRLGGVDVPAGLIVGTVEVAGQDYLTMSFRRLQSATGATYAFEAAAAPGGPWVGGSGQIEVTVTDEGSTEFIVGRDRTPLTAPGARHLRLSASVAAP